MDTETQPEVTIGGANPPRSREAQQLARILAEARNRLIDTGSKNRLIHTNRRSKRPATLAILHSDPNLLFVRLRSGDFLKFRPDPAATARERSAPPREIDEEIDVEHDGFPPQSAEDALQTRLGESSLQKRLLKLARDAKTSEEEQGVNILYLAMGFLRWYEDENSEMLREAPLLLIPVTLNRDVRRSTFELKAREDDLTLNQPLAERLQSDFGIVLPPLPEGDDWAAESYFFSVVEAIGVKTRWSVDLRGIELGFFSFAKLLMFHDLSPKPWPGEKILTHPLLRGLLQEGFAEETEPFPEGTRIDEKFSAADLIHVLDADGSQTLAIETARTGRNLVVQGPPGTGKSQTITNILASAAYDGKKVLFVAEKMVALDVVHRRLVKTGLNDICLELHSRSANKRSVVAELGRTLLSTASGSETGNTAIELTKTRDALNDLSSLLHTQIEGAAMSPFEVLGDLVRARGRNLPPPSLKIGKDVIWSQSSYGRLMDAVSRVQAAMVQAGPLEHHAWYGSGNAKLQPLDLQRLRQELQECEVDLIAIIARLSEVANSIGVASPTTLKAVEAFLGVLSILAEAPRGQDALLKRADALSTTELELLSDLCIAGRTVSDRDITVKETFVETALETNVAPLRSAIARGGTSLIARFGTDYRRASAELASWTKGPIPKSANDRVEMLDRLIGYQAARNRFQDIGTNGPRLLGELYQGQRTDFAACQCVIDWLQKARVYGLSGISRALTGARELTHSGQSQTEIEVLSERLVYKIRHILDVIKIDSKLVLGTDFVHKADLGKILDRIQIYKNAIESYPSWVILKNLDMALRNAGGTDLADRLASGRLSPDNASEELRYARAEILWRELISSNPRLEDIEGAHRSNLVDTFRRLDVSRRHEASIAIQARHSNAIPRGAMGEMAIVRGEIARKRGHMPIRKLMARAGKTIQEIKPILLMSPLSVAQFLPPGSVEFDLAVFDEASQIRPEDALGIIARTKQIVVVGDTKQLPPTNFFSRLLEDESPEYKDEDEVLNSPLAGAASAGDMESILSLCEARGLPSRMLRWHYRSRHPSLIEVSNVEFYDSNLIFPPAPQTDREQDGLVLCRVAGAYDRGGKRINVIEATQLVAAVIRHAVERPKASLGIVTFSITQRDLITNLLDEQRRTNPTLDAFLSDGAEEVFVKNLENVQGDERDVILISVGYGPRIAGGRLDNMSFGPVSMDGGERRLNVLFTRARLRCQVFISFDPGEIDTSRASGRGAQALKRFLMYAETGVIDQKSPTGADHDSAFEADVAQVIKGFGYLVDAQVGSAGFRLDLGVRDADRPGRYILAVECDGATYHHALWARERDRLRQELLEGLGWRFHRIWSTDWFRGRESAIEHLRTALEQARQCATSPPKPNHISDTSPELLPPNIETSRLVPAFVNSNTKYTPSLIKLDQSFFGREGNEPHEVRIEALSGLVRSVIETEGPVHSAIIAQRVASMFKKDRAGARIVKATDAALQALRRTDASVAKDAEIWFTLQQASECPVRDRAGCSGLVLKAEMLPAIEVKAAVQVALTENGGLSSDEAVVSVARLLGFSRTGADLRQTIMDSIRKMIRDEKIQDVGNRLRWA